jgi:isopenicillin-N epimerase
VNISPWRALWALDPDTLFLNHGSFGACPTAILDEQARWRCELEREPVAFFEDIARKPWADARAALATFLGAEPADLVFVNNATSGVNTVLRSYTFEAGDELLVTDHAYQACRNALDYVAERENIRVIVAEVPFPIASPDEAVTAILDSVTPRTRLALIDHITSATGIILPVERIIGELGERGVDTLVDGAHVPGHLDLDLGKLGAAYYTGNCHKWLCTPKGTAFLHVRRDLQTGVRPLTISHAASLPPDDPARFQAEFDWPGTTDPTGFLTIPAAIEFLGSLMAGGGPAVRAHTHALAMHARAVIGERLNIPPAAPKNMLGNLVAFPLKNEASIQVPVYRWFSPPRRLLRISAQLYNHADEYVRLADVLHEFGEAI